MAIVTCEQYLSWTEAHQIRLLTHSPNGLHLMPLNGPLVLMCLLTSLVGLRAAAIAFCGVVLYHKHIENPLPYLATYYIYITY